MYCSFWPVERCSTAARQIIDNSGLRKIEIRGLTSLAMTSYSFYVVQKIVTFPLLNPRHFIWKPPQHEPELWPTGLQQQQLSPLSSCSSIRQQLSPAKSCCSLEEDVLLPGEVYAKLNSCLWGSFQDGFFSLDRVCTV